VYTRYFTNININEFEWYFNFVYTITLVDKLTKNLVINAIENDRRENLNKRPMDRSNKNLDALIKCIRSCGISFNVWEKAEEDCRGGLYDFTSLMGSDKRLLLKTLPSKLATILPDNTSGTIVRLWQVLIGTLALFWGRPCTFVCTIYLLCYIF
jgi:hypothetical protein